MTSRLCLAIRRGRLSDVKREVSCRTMNAARPETGSPLLHAYKRGRVDFMAVLLCHGPLTADVIQVFRLAAQDGQEGMLKMILEADRFTDLFSRDDCFQVTEALHLAVKSGRLGAVKILLEFGAKVDGKDYKNRTPLYHAYTKGDTQVVEALVKHGANIKIRVGGRKLVDNAVIQGNLKMLKALLQQGLPDNYEDDDDSEDDDCDEDEDDRPEVDGTALHIATAKGQTKIVYALLKAGFNIEAENEEGTRPIHLALKHAKILDLLLKAGADVDARDGNWDSSLHIASLDYNLKAVKQLLSYGADVEVCDRKRTSVVGLALRMMYLPLLELLWDYTDHIDHLCCSSYECGTECGFVRMTSLEFACSQNLMPIVSALLERGADFEGQASHCIRRLKEGRSAMKLSEIPDVFEQHFIKLKTAQLTEDAAYKKHAAMPLTLKPLQREQFRETCEAEVSRLKEQRIPNTGYTFYDMFTKNEELCRNDDVVDYFQSQEIEGLRIQFPEYFRLLHVHFRKGLERRRLTDMCCPLFPDLTAYLLNRIFRYLSLEDLANLKNAGSEWKKPMEFRPPCCHCTFNL